MRMLILVLLAAVGLFTAAETTPAQAQVGIYIGPPRYEPYPPPPPPRRYRREYYYEDGPGYYEPPPPRYVAPPPRSRYYPPRNGRCGPGYTVQDGLCKPYRGY